tara:strand:+ start:670 stop:1251 length:582 start_codon:yes stop_codon:yes gene_type:complete
MSKYKKNNSFSVVQMVLTRGNWIKEKGDWQLITTDEHCYCLEDYQNVRKNDKIILNSYSGIYSLCTHNGRKIWIPTYCLSKSIISQMIIKHNLSRSLKFHLLKLQLTNNITTADDLHGLLLQDFIEINKLDIDCQRILRMLNEKDLIELFEWGYKLNARNASALVIKRIEKIKARVKTASTPLFDKRRKHCSV